MAPPQGKVEPISQIICASKSIKEKAKYYLSEGREWKMENKKGDAPITVAEI